jgi:hypothetical protein
MPKNMHHLVRLYPNNEEGILHVRSILVHRIGHKHLDCQWNYIEHNILQTLEVTVAGRLHFSAWYIALNILFQ